MVKRGTQVNRAWHRSLCESLKNLHAANSNEAQRKNVFVISFFSMLLHANGFKNVLISSKEQCPSFV